MGFAFLWSSTVIGLHAMPIRVEADVSNGLPKFHLVGLPDTAVSESRERVRAAMKNSSLAFPRTVITVNLAPADVRKQGPVFDLAVALALLGAQDEINIQQLQDAIFLGELALDGSVRPVRGVLLAAMMAKKHGFARLFVAEANTKEAALVAGVQVYGVGTLTEAVQLVTHKIQKEPEPHGVYNLEALPYMEGLEHIRGHEHAKRALEIAAGGGHNLLMSGPPGSGKTMLARTLPSLLPAMTFEEALEATAIHSVCGLLPSGNGLLTERPFRAPHHTASGVALVGGGANPRPGEVSLAHRGVLFLDEFPEFSRPVLENLRQPLEDGIVTVSRALGSITFPARCMLVASMNPCPCGYLHDRDRTCTCTPHQVAKYQNKVSGPLLDRLDLTVHVPRVPVDKLVQVAPSEPSQAVRERITHARERQRTRLMGTPFHMNAEITGRQLAVTCALDAKSLDLLKSAIDRLHLSPRAYTRVLKVSRTIADLAHAESIRIEHVAEALQYRGG